MGGEGMSHIVKTVREQVRLFERELKDAGVNRYRLESHGGGNYVLVWQGALKTFRVGIGYSADRRARRNNLAALRRGIEEDRLDRE